jgi:hypothetical protein
MDTHTDHLVAKIYYLKPDPLYDEERPYAIASDPPPGLRKTNILMTPVETLIRNVRGKEDQFSLYTCGFEWAHHSLSYELDTDQAVDRYLDDMSTFLCQHLKASKVVPYDYAFREERKIGERRAPGVPRTVKRQILGAHLDTSRESSIASISLKCGQEAESLLKRQWHIVNIWRPLKGPVKSMPLAVCDSRSLALDDVVASDIVLPHLHIMAYEIWYNDEQRWHYLKHQRTDEVLLMMSVDSETLTRCAHSAFEDPNTLPNDPKRYSIEIRCMVFF